MPELTFVIPTIYNRIGLKRCIDTIYKYHKPETFRIIVIDNSKERYGDIVADQVHLIVHSYRNLGFGKAANIGIKLADTEYVCVMNDDIELINSKYWDNIKEVFSRSPKIMAVSPSSIKAYPVNPANDILPYKEEYPESDWEFLMSEKNPMGKILGFSEKFNKQWVFDGTMHYAVYYKRKMFDIVGYYDEGFWPGGGGDDYDFCRRICMHKYRIVQTCNSFVYHHWCVSQHQVKPTIDEYKKYRRWSCFDEKWNYPGEKKADIYGNHGRQDVATLEVCL